LRYSNPLPPEGINTSTEHPLKEFALLTSALIVLVVAFVAAVGLFTEKFAHHIPFKTEVAIAKTLERSVPDDSGEIKAWLQTLAEQLAAAQNLPEDLSITIHYVNNDTVNAMASLGGHIIIFRGLLEKLDSENAIAMVLAHEIAHIHYRHPIQSLGRSAVVSLALTAIGISAGDTGDILGSAGLLTVLAFSRKQEQQADEAALLSLYRHYGHVDGAKDLFRILLHEEPKALVNTSFFSTHPLSEKRIDNITAYSRQQGWPLSGKLVPPPKTIRDLIAADSAKSKADPSSTDS